MCVFWLMCIGVACAKPPPPSLYGNHATSHQENYQNVLDTWSRSAKIYQEFENKLFITATYHTLDLRQAFALSFPDIYGHGSNITRRELVDLSDGVGQYNNFFLSVYTPNIRWNDLAKNDSIWHLTLHSPTCEPVSAAEIVPIKVDENIRAVYPYVSRFDRIYLVRFPLADANQRPVISATTKAFTLRIASALGVAEMTWELMPTLSINPSKT